MNSVTIIILLVLPIVYADTTSDFRCGSWQLLGDQKCYKVVERQVSRQDANGACNEADGNGVSTRSLPAYNQVLLTIKSKSQQTYVLNYLSNELHIDAKVWVGAKRNGRTDTFHWEDGSPVLYNNWAKDRPSEDTTRSCAQLNPKTGEWEDTACDGTAYVVCERTQFWTFPDLQKEFYELRELLEFWGQELRAELAIKDRLIHELSGKFAGLEGQLIGLRAQLNGFSIGVNASINRLSHENIEIKADVSELKDTTDRLSDAVYQLHKECSEGCSGSGGSGGGSGDLDALRKELLAEINSKYGELEAELKDTVSDARFATVNYRRQLQIKKDDKWKGIGYA